MTTLDRLSDYWGRLPTDVKGHILTFTRHPVAALVPKNHRWVLYKHRRRYVDTHPILADFAEIHKDCQDAFAKNFTWRHFILCDKWDNLVDSFDQDALTDGELDIIERQAKQILEWQDRLNRIAMLTNSDLVRAYTNSHPHRRRVHHSV